MPFSGYAVRKAAAAKLPAKGRDCRKRASAGKVAASGVADTAGLVPQPVLVPACGKAAFAARQAGAHAVDAARHAGMARAPPAKAA